MDGFFREVSKNFYLDSRLQLEMEQESPTSPTDLDLKQDVEYKQETRPMIIAWIFRACEELTLNVNTAYLTIDYLSRFLSVQRVKKTFLLEFAQACLLIAAKFNESYPPSVRFLIRCFGADPSFIPRLLQMEMMILEQLDWKLDVVTVFHYLLYFSKKIKVNDATKTEILKLAMYFSRYVITRCDCLRFKTSEIALILIAYSEQTLLGKQLDDIVERDLLHLACQVESNTPTWINECRNLLRLYFSEENPSELLRNKRRKTDTRSTSSSPTHLVHYF